MDPNYYSRCKGDWEIGNNCGKCEHCLETAPAYIAKLRAQKISPQLVVELDTRYKSLAAVRGQIDIARWRNTSGYIALTAPYESDARYEFTMKFTWQEIINILEVRREEIIREISNLGGEIV